MNKKLFEIFKFKVPYNLDRSFNIFLFLFKEFNLSKFNLKIMRTFGADINRPLLSVADQSIEAGRELLGNPDAGTRLKLIAHIDQLVFLREAYANLIHFLNVNSMATRLIKVPASGAHGRPACFQLGGLFAARKSLESSVMVGANQLLVYIRDMHQVPVVALLEEISLLSNPNRGLGGRKFDGNFRKVNKMRKVIFYILKIFF